MAKISDAYTAMWDGLTGVRPHLTEYVRTYLADVQQIAATIDPAVIDRVISLLKGVRASGGRVFFLGVGGGAGYASHAVSDFRKTAGLESYAPSDNPSELTARINDEGWETAYSDWLVGSHLQSRDALFLFSVGGGSLEKNVSVILVNALRLAAKVGAKITGIVGRDGGYAAEVSHDMIVVPTFSSATVTALTESFQAVIWHCIVTHPDLKLQEMKWESAK